MEKPPNELIKLMTSDDVDKTMNSVAILNPPEDPCESERYQATNKAINWNNSYHWVCSGKEQDQLSGTKKPF